MIIQRIMFILLLMVSSPFVLAKQITEPFSDTVTASWIKAAFPKTPNRLAETIAVTINDVAIKQNIDPTLLLGLISLESGFRPHLTSPMGAKGLTQVVPRFHKSKIKGKDLYDPKVNIEIGASILKDCLDKHRGNVNKALGCYSGHGSKNQAGKAYIAKVTGYQSKAVRYLAMNTNKGTGTVMVAVASSPIQQAENDVKEF